MFKLGLLVVLGYIIVLGAALYGWLQNILYISSHPITPITGEVILRVIGIFMAPIGVVMGYL